MTINFACSESLVLKLGMDFSVENILDVLAQSEYFSGEDGFIHFRPRLVRPI